MLLCQRNVALLYYYFDYAQKSSLCVDTSVQMLCTQFNLMYTDGGKGHIVAESCPFCPANVDLKCFIQFPFPNYIFIRPRYRFDHCIVLPALSLCQQGYISQTKLNFAQDLSNLLHGFFKVVITQFKYEPLISPAEANVLKWLNRFFKIDIGTLALISMKEEMKSVKSCYMASSKQLHIFFTLSQTKSS